MKLSELASLRDRVARAETIDYQIKQLAKAEKELANTGFLEFNLSAAALQVRYSSVSNPMNMVHVCILGLIPDAKAKFLGFIIGLLNQTSLDLQKELEQL